MVQITNSIKTTCINQFSVYKSEKFFFPIYKNLCLLLLIEINLDFRDIYHTWKKDIDN